jgi:hypothetical protein
MLLKRKNDDQLKWPVNLQYKLGIRIQEPHKMTVRGRQVTSPRHVIRTVRLPDNLERVSSAYACSIKEIADIDLPKRELLNYEMN